MLYESGENLSEERFAKSRQLKHRNMKNVGGGGRVVAMPLENRHEV